MKRNQHVERPAPAQFRTPSAEDELLRLHEELDLADPSPPELDVVAGDRDLVVPAHRMDLPLHRVHVGDRGEIEILAPDERREVLQKSLAQADVARHGTRLDKRGALPILPHRLVIGVGGGQRHGGGSRARIRAEPIIDAMDVAVWRALLEKPRELLRDPRIDRRRLRAFGKGRRLRVEEDDEIDVAGIVELSRSVLAQRKHRETGSLARRIGVGERDAPETRRLREHEVDAAAHRRIGEIRERLRRILDAPDAAEIGERHQKRVGVPVAPESAHDVGAGEAAGPELAEQIRLIVRERPSGLLRRAPGQPGEPGRIDQDELPEERRMVRDRHQKVAQEAGLEMGKKCLCAGLGLGPFDEIGQAGLGPFGIRDRRGFDETVDQGSRVHRPHIAPPARERQMRTGSTQVRNGTTITARNPGPLSSSRRTPP